MADDWEPDPNGLAQVVELANMARTPGQHQETHAVRVKKFQILFLGDFRASKGVFRAPKRSEKIDKEVTNTKMSEWCVKMSSA